MDVATFRMQLLSYADYFRQTLTTPDGEWAVKGFIDVFRNIYTISVDTKVISKIVELMLFPLIARFAQEYNYDLILSAHQNHYPDITFGEIADQQETSVRPHLPLVLSQLLYATANGQLRTRKIRPAARVVLP